MPILERPMTPAVKRWLARERERLEKSSPRPWATSDVCHDADHALIVAAVNDRAAVLRLVEAVAIVRSETQWVQYESALRQMDAALVALVGEETEKETPQ
jgi:hypothetical protein